MTVFDSDLGILAVEVAVDSVSVDEGCFSFSKYWLSLDTAILALRLSIRINQSEKLG